MSYGLAESLSGARSLCLPSFCLAFCTYYATTNGHEVAASAFIILIVIAPRSRAPIDNDAFSHGWMGSHAPLLSLSRPSLSFSPSSKGRKALRSCV